ncbi:hypothetical protein 1 [Hubei sobemo-like virus 40]|uniref:hypothetical protein 1 n=1 Tax=Hubei sobemo-like virus 40 TaxID=1923228 RepID=UPI00090BFEB2|nr:hypothetical protein 1 [Hubei sobemo-like virus 40]APG75799.1 hypothetical protein 1 [Hubei sobemo-like virus 40]
MYTNLYPHFSAAKSLAFQSGIEKSALVGKAVTETVKARVNLTRLAVETVKEDPLRAALTVTSIVSAGWVLKKAVPFAYRKYREWRERPWPVIKEAPSYEPETAVEGSVETNMSFARCQGALCVAEGQTWKTVGGCFRLTVGSKDLLLTAGHNLVEGERYAVSRMGKIKELGDVWSAKDADQIYSPVTDIVAIPLPDSFFSGLSMRSATTIALPSSTNAQITGALGKGSVGKLHPLGQFGRVEYAGTTAGGYSGCPYIVGERVAAIHTNGGRKNEGWEIKYVECLLYAHFVVSNESTVGSEDAARRAAQEEHDIAPYDDDSIIIRSRKTGKYYRTRETVYEELMRAKQSYANNPDRWADQVEVDLLQQELDSYMPECASEAGNAKTPAQAGVGQLDGDMSVKQFLSLLRENRALSMSESSEQSQLSRRQRRQAYFGRRMGLERQANIRRRSPTPARK